MRVVLDAMGGDHAPAEVVKGAVEAAREYGLAITLVGPDELIRAEVSKHGGDGLPLLVVHAPDVIAPDEAPVAAVRKKKDSSLVTGLNLVREGKGQALVSAGSTGALMAGGLFILRRIQGIDRPAIGTVLPTVDGNGCLVLDLGAGVDARPENLYQYAVMGSIYMRHAHGLKEPRVGILNVGTEQAKGNEVTKKAFDLLSGSSLNFVGNVEGRDISYGKADVVVCDGFVGNIVLKYAEGMGESLFALLRESLRRNWRSRLGALLLAPALKAVVKKVDYTEYGGAPLLGLQGVVIKCHGSSNAKAIKHGLRVARELVEHDLVGKIAESLAAGAGGEEAGEEELTGPGTEGR